MTGMSLTGYVSVRLDRFLQPFVQTVPSGYAKPVKELVFLILGAASTMVKMEHLGIVRDGSGKTTGPGYWLVGAFLRLKRGRIVPMLMRCFSTVQPGIKSSNAVIVQALSQLREVLTEGRGILVCDRGLDAIRLLEPLLKHSLRFIVRLVGHRDLLFYEDGRWRKHNLRKWLDAQLAGEWRALVATVRLPQREEVLRLVVAPARTGRQKDPLMLLTRGVLTRRHDAHYAVRHIYVGVQRARG